jgi:hypothetical protein
MQNFSRSFAFLALMSLVTLAPALSDEVTESHSSSSSSVGITEKKGFAFKYSERLKNWSEQVDMGISKGWLTADDAQKFKTRLADLKTLNDSVSGKGYPKADLDAMEKQFTQFNIDLSNTASKPKTSSAASGATSGQKAGGAKPGAKTTTK